MNFRPLHGTARLLCGRSAAGIEDNQTISDLEEKRLDIMSNNYVREIKMTWSSTSVSEAGIHQLSHWHSASLEQRRKAKDHDLNGAAPFLHMPVMGV